MHVVARIVLFLSITMSLSGYAAKFSIQPLSKQCKDQLIKQGHWQPGCPVSLDRLRLLTFDYYTFQAEQKVGHLIVMDAAADHLLAALKQLYQRQFPLSRPVAMIDEGDHDEEYTMAFNCRQITGGQRFSIHAYGLAIDINPRENPYAGGYRLVKPGGQLRGRLIPDTTSVGYLNRWRQSKGMNEAIVSIMKQHGFTIWGGNWRDRLDYMHFQVPSAVADHLARLSSNDAKRFYELVVRYPTSASRLSADSRWFYLYQLFPDRYITVMQQYFSQLANTPESTVFNQIYNDLIQS